MLRPPATGPFRSLFSEQDEKGTFLKWPMMLGVALILVLTVVVYLPSLGHAFLNWDDDHYITGNESLRPLSPASVSYAFKEFRMGNYHPVTMLSYGWDMDATGPDAHAFKRSALVLHLINIVLVYFFVARMFGNAGMALFIAAAFALHPHHVEVVAWISARKDLLSTMFMLLSLLAYLAFLDRRKLLWYVLALLAFILACLSKATAVALPLLLFLILWYKERLSRSSIAALVPYFLIALLVGLVAIAAQDANNALGRARDLDALQRMLVTLGALGRYTWWDLVPYGMSGYHPYPKGEWALDRALVWGIVFLALIVLVLIRTRDRVALVGFAGSTVLLLPVLQILPVGEALMADRYTYFSSVWLLPGAVSILHRSIPSRTIIAGLGLAYLVFATYATATYLPVWKNSITFWTSVTERYPGFANGWMQLGHSWDERPDLPGNSEKAVEAYERAIVEDPLDPYHHNVAGLAIQERSLEKALQYFNEGIRLDPASPQLRYNRAMVLIQLEDHAAAIPDIQASIALDSTFAQAYTDLGIAYAQVGQLDSAMILFEEAIQRDPSGGPSVLVARASVLFKAGRWGEARSDVEEALRMDPLKGEGYHVRGLMHLAVGDSVNACKDLYSAFTMLSHPGQREEVRALGMTLCPNGPE